MKTIQHLFTALLLLCTTAVATAHDFEVNGIYYNITNYSNKTVAVTYKGSSYSAYSNEYTGSVVIPESVTYNATTYSVTSIGDYAFDGCSGLTSIEIPNSVTSIGSSAFSGCSGLTSITIPNSVTSIGRYAFSGCSALTSVVIPNSVTSIMDGAFDGCSGLTSIEIPNSVTSIGHSAFYGCSGLTSITIPNSVTSIGNKAFYGCSALTSVEIPNSVTSIRDSAFYNCSGLTSIVIPNSVTSIGIQAFYGCSGLTSVTIPNSVTSIGDYAFRGCSGLTSITIPNSVTSIGGSAFYGCSGLTSVEFNAENCTSMGSYSYPVFSNCTALSTVIIGENVKNIPNYAFSGCTGLTSIVIPNSVTSIGDYAFYGCSGLKTVINFSNLTLSKRSTGNGYVAYYATKVINAPNAVIEGDFIFGKPNGVNTLVGYLGNTTELTLPADYNGENYEIGNDAFSGCSGLTSIEIPNSVTSIGNKAFYGCTGLKTIINFSNLTFSKGSSGNGYVAYYADKVYNVPNGSNEDGFIFGKPKDVNTLVVYLGNATELTLPANYKGGNYDIGADAFKGNTTITSIEIPNSVTSIGDSAFSGCTGLTSIEIPNSVTSIGASAFEGCNNIEKLYIGSSVESIGDKAFTGCEKITEIKVALGKPIRGSADIFTNAVYDNATLYIPNGTEQLYQKREPWNLFFYIVEMDFTGIDEMPEEVRAESGKGKTIYDLQGRKVEVPSEGLYIIDGKKVLIK